MIQLESVHIVKLENDDPVNWWAEHSVLFMKQNVYNAHQDV